MNKQELEAENRRLTDEIEALYGLFPAMRDAVAAGAPAHWVIGYAGNIGSDYDRGNPRVLRAHAEGIRRDGPPCQCSHFKYSHGLDGCGHDGCGCGEFRTRLAVPVTAPEPPAVAAGEVVAETGPGLTGRHPAPGSISHANPSPLWDEARVEPRRGCKCGHTGTVHHLNFVGGDLTYCNACPAGECEKYEYVPASVTA